jgi:nitrite reductase/ring-hydroxylating ferredoxin subunit
MDPAAMGTGAIRLCAVSDVPDGGSRGLTLALPGGSRVRVFAVRRGDSVWAYLNRCPHRGTPLDWRPDDFLDRDGRHIVCATHGAVFRVEDGVCIAGPCPGEQLAPLPLERRGEELFAPADPGE